MLVMRVLYSCSELGLGHASRTRALGKVLEQRGHEVFFFTGGNAYEVLKKEFSRVSPVTPVAWYENGNGIITSASLLNILFPLPTNVQNTITIKSSSAMETVHRYYDLRENIRTIAPDVIVADGDIHALRLSLKWKIPSVYITNLIRPSFGFSSLLSPGERITEQYVKKVDKIIIPDNKPPYTICEYNIGNLRDAGVYEKTEFVGSFFDTQPVEGSEQHIFAPISGPSGTRSKLLRMIVPVLQKLGVKSIISTGEPGEPKKVTVGNCELHTWLTQQERQEAMRNASMVIFSGGHITCFETVKYRKPSICIPTQPEQLANAGKLQNLNCSLIAKNKTQLEQAIKKMQEQLKQAQKSMDALNQFSNGFHGLERAAQIIEETKNSA
jgi:uncharacterized protein (TIGR00661 family)